MSLPDHNFCAGEKITLIEHTPTEETFKWEALIEKITPTYIETSHSRNPITHPQWLSYTRAYSKTWTKHYGLTNIKKNHA